ncbi:hypothetical protein, partial [Corynebacterium sp. KPL2825]|uniref:hypothetical protein n=1 Tax=Corynebacterium sp. KPL2825 TaxID=3135444 RepID=UPI0030C9F238
MTHVAPSVQRKPALIFSLMAQEPLKLKRKFNVFLPLALIGRNQAVDAPRLNSSLSISRGVAPPRI